MGLTQSYVCHILRLNKLPPLIVDGYYTHSISVSHLFVISRLKTHEEMTALYEKALSESLTVAQTEILVREALYGVKSEGDYIDRAEKDLLDVLKQEGIDASLTQSRVRGKITLEVKGDLTHTTLWLRKLVARLVQK